jgi:signal transduction histidine kinase
VLDNAIKYSRDGGKVRVSMSKDPTFVWIGIHDEGIGIAKADLPHIFERFFLADPARNRSSGGTGLGLSLVKWVVEAHRGRIKVASEPDRGTDFQIAFPLQVPAPKAGAESRAAKASRPTQHARSR